MIAGFITKKADKRFQIQYAVSTKDLGPMRKNREVNGENFSAFVSSLSIAPTDAVTMNQVHGSVIENVYTINTAEIRMCDGMVTGKMNTFLCVFTADCLPLLFYDPAIGLIGVAHAGYRGILAGIVKNMVLKFIEAGSKSGNIYVIAGPSIKSCCYDVSGERIELFRKIFPSYKKIYRKEKNRYFLGLDTVVSAELKSIGIYADNITVMPECTKCENGTFFSYRADNHDSYGEFVSCIGMKTYEE